MKKKPTKRAGVATPLALFAVVILSAAGVGLLSLGVHSRTFSIRTAQQIQAQIAADAGVEKALFEMNEKLDITPWSDSDLPQVTDQPLLNCDATFSYTVTGDSVSGFTIESIGKLGATEKRITTELYLQGPFEFAIFTMEEMELKESTTVDWYNNDEDDETLKIGTNSIDDDTVELKNNVAIYGDVVVGPDGVPSIVIRDTGATITGDTYAMPLTNTLSAVTVPASIQSLTSGGTINNSGTISTPAKYDEINLQSGETITIDNNVTLYIIGDLTLGNSAELQISNNSNASLVLYLGGDLEGKSSSNFNNLTQDPKKLKIYALDTSDQMRFKNSSEFYGAIYAPSADVEFFNSADAYGSIVAEDFEQKNSASFHYDASLRDADTDDEIVNFVLRRWTEE